MRSWPQFYDTIMLTTCPGAKIDFCIHDAMEFLHSQSKFAKVEFKFNDRMITITKNTTITHALKQYFGGRDEI